MFFRNSHSHGYIRPDMTNNEIIYLMSEGKPAVIGLFTRIIERYDMFELLSLLIVFDSIGVYSSCILKLFYEYCGHSYERFLNLVSEMTMDTRKIVSVKKYLKLL